MRDARPGLLDQAAREPGQLRLGLQRLSPAEEVLLVGEARSRHVAPSIASTRGFETEAVKRRGPVPTCIHAEAEAAAVIVRPLRAGGLACTIGDKLTALDAYADWQDEIERGQRLLGPRR